MDIVYYLNYAEHVMFIVMLDVVVLWSLDD